MNNPAEPRHAGRSHCQDSYVQAALGQQSSWSLCDLGSKLLRIDSAKESNIDPDFPGNW